MIESTYTRGIHKRLPSEVYAWKVSDRFTAGVPDAWYSGDAGDLWVEYKYLQKCPKKHKPKLSARQLDWLNSRYDQGRNVAVIVGTPNGGVILTAKKWTQQVIFGNLMKPADIAIWIANQVSRAKTAQAGTTSIMLAS